MTFQAFSTKNKPLRHAFRIALKDGTVPGIIGTLLLSGIIISSTLAVYSNPNHADDIIYMIIRDMGSPEPVLFIVALISIIQALFSFQMLYQRGSANFYFSAGLNRSQLFTARFAAGMSWLSLAVFLSMVGSAAANLTKSVYAATQTGLIIGNTLIVGFGFLLTALIVYTVTALVCALSGTLAETLVYSILALFLPTFIFLGLNGQMIKFLWGNAHDVQDIWSYNLPDNLVISLAGFNPLLFFDPYVSAYGSRIAGQAAPVVPTWGPVLGWILITAILVWLARKFFIGRKVENTGLRGTCKPLGFVLLFPLIYVLCSIPLYIASGLSPITIATAIASGFGLSAAAFVGLSFPLRLIDRPVWKGVLIYPVYLAMIGAIVVILLTGGLGYANYQPRFDDIVRMSISYKGMPNMIIRGSYSSVSGFVDKNNNMNLVLEDAEDIKTALILHRQLIEQGDTQPGEFISNDTLVEYTLQNGTKVSRFYRTDSSDILGSMLSLDQTKAFRDLFKGYMNRTNPEPDNLDQYYHNVTSPLSNGVLYLGTPLSDQVVLINDDLSAKIRQALADDMENQSIEERYRPSVSESFILYFYANTIYQNDSGGSTYPQSPDIEYFDSGFLSRIYIDQSCPKTLEILSEITMKPEDKEIESIQIIGPYWDMLINTDNRDLASCFSSSYLRLSKLDTRMTISDPDRIDELFRLSRGFYFAGDKGYLIIAYFQDSEMSVTRYIPRIQLPEWAK